MAARSIGSGTISFGLVSIPIRLYTAASSKQVSFNLLHEPCKGRLRQELRCNAHDPPVVIDDRDRETVRGYEYSRDQYVTFTKEELTALESSRDRLELLQFVPVSTVDLLYIERSFFLGPDKGGTNSYRLLAQALERSQRVAVGLYAKRGKDTLVLVRSYNGGLLLHECYYADEVRSITDVDGVAGATPALDKELALAGLLIDQLAKPAFDPSEFKDRYAERVEQAVAQKVAGEQVVVAPAAAQSNVIDLLEALKQSVVALEVKKDAANDSKPVPKGPKKAAPRKSVDAKKRRGSEV